MIYGAWQSTTIADGETESAEVDLGKNFSKVLALSPILGQTLTIHVSNTSGGTFYPVRAFDADASGSFAHTTETLNAAAAIVFKIGGAQFIKLIAGGAVSGDKTLLCRGC